VEQELRLNEFKALYKVWKRGVPWLDHLLLGLLVWFETKLLSTRVENEVDEAIREWKTLQDELFMDELLGPVYTEKPSDTSTRLPEMRLTAPWYIDTYDEK
jgi:hypothetical protein